MLGRNISAFVSRFSDMWKSVPPLASKFGRSFSPSEQLENELRLKAILPGNMHSLERQNDVRIYIPRLRHFLTNLILRSVDSRWREEISAILGPMFDAGSEFAEQAREYDRNLQIQEIFQALRNIWIVNSIQAGFGLPVRVNPSGFSYSLLYTYTDSFLDNEDVTYAEKVRFGSTFEQRLRGIDVESETEMFSKVSNLVLHIEEEHPRSSFPDVYESLLAIHRAQQQSLRQRFENGSDILAFTVEKGGTSVLADGFLIKGELTHLEQEICFGYGVFLQMIDDLQDVEEDLNRGSETLFTQAARENTLDEMTCRLAAYIRKILDSAGWLIKSRVSGLMELILQGCYGIILESVALNPKLFSEEFACTHEPFSPLSFEAIRSLHKDHALMESELVSLPPTV